MHREKFCCFVIINMNLNYQLAKYTMNDFVSSEKRVYRFKLGTVIASSLSGFVAGVVVASILWMLYVSVYSVM